jgi:hypothetical protein
MNKKIVFACLAIAVACALTSASFAAEPAKAQTKNFWQKLFNYPANVTRESAGVVNDTGKNSANVVIDEVKTIGAVTTGSIDKSVDLVAEPIKGTVETTAKAVVETVNAPIAAAKEDAGPITEATTAAVTETAKIASETTAGSTVDAAKATAQTLTFSQTAPAKAADTK